MIKGVSKQEYSIIKNILKNYDAKFFAFGSRVKGDFSDFSDLDILVKCKDFESIINKLKTDFDESYIPYIVNFTNFNTIDEKFYNIIKNDLIEI